MLIKVRKLGATFSAPELSQVNGEVVLKAEMLGELVKVGEPFVEAAELIVGELTMGFFPVGIEVQLDGENEKLNGLWVQREVLNAIRAQAAQAA